MDKAASRAPAAVASDDESQSTMDTVEQGDDVLNNGDDGASDAAEDADEEESPIEDPTRSAAVVAYLETYGFFVDHPACWPGAWRDGTLPVARLRVRVHTERSGHTLYLVECALTPLGGDESALTWSTLQRLSQIRDRFHDRVKRALGPDAYRRHFQATPFARRMGLPGTTSRLHAWFQTLAACMTAGFLRPSVVAELLQNLEAPSSSRRSVSQPEGVSNEFRKGHSMQESCSPIVAPLSTNYAMAEFDDTDPDGI
mmetsp:Transcript_77339/g.224383  ORF Transcript_77339/g.224383 Transcript_77339/m.224383 type:complete len:256 (-) Transcript_77339:294-1061(-)